MVKLLTVLVRTVSNSQVFLLKNMWVAFANAKATHIFSQKNIRIYAIFNDQNFNDTLTNDCQLLTTGPRCSISPPKYYVFPYSCNRQPSAILFNLVLLSVKSNNLSHNWHLLFPKHFSLLILNDMSRLTIQHLPIEMISNQMHSAVNHPHVITARDCVALCMPCLTFWT